MKRPALAWLWSLVAAWTVAASCAAAAQTVRDDRGVEHRFERPPQRIVTLLPSLTESICALGACGRLVGTDRYSNHPPQVHALPKLGGLDDAVVERIVALRPEVVLSARSTRANVRLEQLGIKVLAFDSDRHEQVRSSLARLGHLIGAEGSGERLWAAIDADLQRAAARVPAALRGGAVYFEADSTPYAAGAASFVGQTLARLGMGNIAPPDMGPFPKLNPEHIVRSQPAVIFASRSQAAQMADRPGWRQLEALRQHRLCVFDEARYELLLRPGPRLGEAAQLMAACLEQLGAAR